MQQWFYEMYGFYPLQMIGGVFFMNGLKYELIPIVDDEPWEEFEVLIQRVCGQLSMQSITIIKNRQKQYVSLYESIRYILIAGSVQEIGVSHIFMLHELSARKTTLDLQQMRTKWIDRCNQLEYEIIPWIPTTIPSYSQMIVCCQVALGLAENAILYLSSLPTDTSLRTCLCNKRIDVMNTWIVYNPSRVVFDHPVRDIAELVKIDVISEQELYGYIALHQMSESELSYLVARLLFPFQLFDCIELLYTEESLTICMNLVEYEEQVQRILVLIRALLIRYSLRPIEWILR